MQKINLNDDVVTELTDAGQQAWAEYWKSTHPNGVPDSVKRSATLPDGKVSFKLWEAMNIFGPHCFMGSTKLPFVENTIEIALGE